jgi:hypothetical protein
MEEEMQIQTTFSKRAEAFLQGEAGLYQFQYGVIPNVGDMLSVRASPSGKTVTFVCTKRHFNFSEPGNHFVELVFDAP